MTTVTDHTHVEGSHSLSLGGTRSSGPSTQTTMEAMAAMEVVLQKLQIELAKYFKQDGEDNQKMGSASAQQLETQYNKELQEIKEIQESESKPWYDKLASICSYIGAAFGGVFALMIGQPEITVLLISVTALQLSGKMDKLTADISSALGVPNWAANLMVVGALMALTAGVGAASAASTSASASVAAVGDDVAFLGGADDIEMGVLGGGDGAAPADEEAAVGGNEAPPQRVGFGKVQFMAFTAGAQTTGLGQSIIAACMQKGKAEEVLEGIIGFIQGVIAAIAAGRVYSAAPMVLSIPVKLRIAALALQTTASLGVMGGNIGQYTQFTAKANAETELAGISAAIDYLETVMQQVQTGTKAVTDRQVKTMAQFEELNVSYAKLPESVMAVARAIAEFYS